MTNETEVLKPCPFCGESWYVYIMEPDEDNKSWTVGCFAQMEGGCGFSSEYTTRTHAIKAWNHRTTTPSDNTQPSTKNEVALPYHASTGLDSFVTRLETALKEASGYQYAQVSKRDLRDILYHFIRLDNEARQQALSNAGTSSDTMMEDIRMLRERLQGVDKFLMHWKMNHVPTDICNEEIGKIDEALSKTAKYERE